jgi:hypothetical protein
MDKVLMSGRAENMKDNGLKGRCREKGNSHGRMVPTMREITCKI